MALQIAVAGMGARGKDWVREIRNDGRFSLAACVDTDAQVLKRIAQDPGLQERQCFSDLNTAIETCSLDAVVVATPADCHVESCELAITRRLAVLVEKPFTLNLQDASRLVQLAAANETPLIVAQNYRYLRSFRTARELILEGRLGRVGLVMLQYYRIPHEMAASLARLSHNVLWGVGVHHLDVLRHVLGANVRRVLAEDFTLPWGELPRGASMQVMMEFENGTRGIYSATYESRGHEFFEGGQEFYARFVGEKATLHVFQRWLILCETGRFPKIIKRGPRKVTEEQVLLSQLEKTITAGAEPDSSGLDNLQTMAIVEACIRSSNEQRWINPQELLNGSK
jgi:predicted dehydrogenase